MFFIKKTNLEVLCLNFFCLLITSCSIFGPLPKIASAPLGDRANWVLVSFPLTRISDFQIATNQKIPIRYKDENLAYALLAKKDWENASEELLFIKKESQDLGFKYFAENYSEQLDRSIFRLSDILSGYKDNALNQKYLNLIQLSFPHLTSVETIGTTKSGKPILALVLADKTIPPKNKQSILFSCAMHANEVITTDHCYDIIYSMLSNENYRKKYLRNLNLWIIPIVNPDGSDAFWHKSHDMGRKNDTEDNFRGVDLNRNFPLHWASSGSEYSSNKIESPYFQGSEMASEFETKAMMNLADSETFIASISYHAFANSLLIPYSIQGFRNPSPDLASSLAKKMIRNVKSHHPQKEFVAKKSIYSVDGVDQDFYFFKHGTLAYIMETSHFNPEYSLVPKILKSFRNVWIQLLHEISTSERIIFHILDESGAPISAKLEFDSLSFFNGETRFNNPKTGLFYLYWIPGLSGRVTILADGYLPRTVALIASKEWKPKKIILKKLD